MGTVQKSERLKRNLEFSAAHLDKNTSWQGEEKGKASFKTDKRRRRETNDGLAPVPKNKRK